ncbi:MAG: hypothetical protein ABIK09_17185 [Pseudomonadota bacterium]
MKSKAFIIEFQEGLDFVQTYRSLLRNNHFVLRTRIPLILGERVKVRFNIPDGNGVTVRCKVATQIDDQAWGIILPKNEDVRWLQERALDAEKRLGPATHKPPADAAPREVGVSRTPPGSTGRNESPGPKSDNETMAFRPEKPIPANGPETVDIAPGNVDALLHFGAPEAEFVDPESDGFPSLKDTGMDLLKSLEDDPFGAGLPMQIRPYLEQEDLGVTQVVRGTRGGGAVDLSGLSALDTAGDAGIDFPHGVKRPSVESIKRLREMSLNHKKQLAISGNATERMILIQDKERAIQLWVLKNPQITEIEIRWLSSMTTLTPEAVDFLAVNRKWASIPDISINLLSNPITPNDAIQRLLTILPTQVLLILHQKPGVRPMVAEMSKKLLMERGEL